MKFKYGPRVLAALSGGVDSAVAAALLIRAGHQVTGAFMINYDPSTPPHHSGSLGVSPHNGRHEPTQFAPPPARPLGPELEAEGEGDRGGGSCWLPDYRDAVRVAAALGIPIIKLDFTKQYRQQVLDYMFREYRAGRTPNPDILCNKFIKFGAWLKQARALGFDYLATGHYARIERDRTPPLPTGQASSPLRRGGSIAAPPSQRRGQGEVSPVRLLTSSDANKDQTYFLNQLTPAQLRHVLFPIGNYTKPQVRQLAKKFKLPVAGKAESMGICFIGEVPMKEFLQTRIKPKPGSIVLSDGTVVGRHEGLPFYTIGQRHIGLSSLDSRLWSQAIIVQSPKSKVQRPLYVLAKRPKTNELVVGYENDPLLYSKKIYVTDVNWTAGHPPKFPLKCLARLRHRQPLQRAVVSRWTLDSNRERNNKVQSPKSKVRLTFTHPQRAVTPGQWAVFYKNGLCLGGGVIK